MAKKRKPGAGRPESPDPRLPIAAFRGRRGFVKWFDGLVRQTRDPKSTLIEKALIHYAKHVGYDAEAPER